MPAQRPRKTQERGILGDYIGTFRDSIVTTETHGEENGTELNREWDCLVVYEGYRDTRAKIDQHARMHRKKTLTCSDLAFVRAALKRFRSCKTWTTVAGNASPTPKILETVDTLQTPKVQKQRLSRASRA